MSAIQCLGKIIGFNSLRKEIVFRISFADENLLGEIEKSINDDSVIKLRFTKSRKDALKTYEQLKRIWSMFTYIVIANNEMATRENIEAVEEYCRCQFYPRRQIYNSLIEKIVKEKSQTIDEPIRLSEQTVDELNMVMKKIELTWPEIFSDRNWHTKFEDNK